MTEPNATAAQSPADLRALVGTQVHVYRDSAREGTGELIEVIPGVFNVYNAETGDSDPVEVEDKTLHWEDVSQGTQVASRRYSNVWRLEPVTP